MTEKKGTPTQLQWAIVDGPATCVDTNPARPEGDDTLIYFSGAAWSPEAAHCRAIDIFLGATPILDPDIDGDGKPDVTVENNFEIPLDAIGYCLINEGTPSEITAYSTCGIQTAGRGACEQTLPKQGNAKVTATWFNCPGGPACAPKSDDACLNESGDGKGYAVFVDDPDFYCAGTKYEGELTDAQDSIMVATGTRFKRSSALCTAAGPYNKLGIATYGVGPISRLTKRNDKDVPILTPGEDPVPNGIADGYCLFSGGLAEEFVLYSLCNGAAPVEPTDAGAVVDGGAAADAGMKPAAGAGKTVLTRQQRCAGFVETKDGDGGITKRSVWGNQVANPRFGEWVSCPGGPLCNLPLMP